MGRRGARRAGRRPPLLVRVVDVIRAHLRPYDVVVRLGGDEFLCVMPGATVQHARQRFRAICGVLAVPPRRVQIRTGFAALGPDDGLDELIRRADAELVAGSRTPLVGLDRPLDP